MSVHDTQSPTLRAILEPIVLDESLTKEQRNEQFLPIIKSLMEEFSYELVSQIWNDTMAAIVIDNKLGRQ